MAASNSVESYCLFETARGHCGLVWSDRGVVEVKLPAENRAATEARLLEARPGAQLEVPPQKIARAIEMIRAHLSGTIQDLGSIELDMSGLTPFRKRVYETLRTVPAGETISYGGLGERMGAPGAARAVGTAMANNPFTLIVPCHRVLASQSGLGGFSAHGGLHTKVDLLALEGAPLPGAALGLSYDPIEAAKVLADADEAMGRLIERSGPIRLLVDPMESPFVALVKAIIYQQLTGKAAKTIYTRLQGLFDDRDPTPEELLDHPDDLIRSVGISRPKTLALKDLAQKTLDGVVPSLAAMRRMKDETIIERLVSIRGIGRWTVEMLLIFRLGRPDVFPIDDLGVRKGITFLDGASELVKPKEAAARSESWRPYRSLASWYLWRAAEMGRDAF